MGGVGGRVPPQKLYAVACVARLNDKKRIACNAQTDFVIGN